MQILRTLDVQHHTAPEVDAQMYSLTALDLEPLIEILYHRCIFSQVEPQTWSHKCIDLEMRSLTYTTSDA